MPGRLRGWRRRAATFSLALAALATLAFATPAGAQGKKLFDQARLRDWLGPVPGDSDVLTPQSISVSGSHGVIRFALGAERCALHVLPFDKRQAGDLTSRSLAMRREGDDNTPCGKLVMKALNRVRYHDLVPAGTKTGPRGPAVPAWLGTVLVSLAALLIGLLPWCVFVALRTCDRRTLWLVAACFALALLARSLAPHKMVMVYFGYEHVGQAIDLDTIPRYGPGATVLWWLLFRLFSPDHAAVQWLHALLGAATVALWAAFAARVTRTLAGGLFAGAVLALAPLFIRDHVSESMAVMAQLCVATAALLLAHTLSLVTAPPGSPHQQAAISEKPRLAQPMCAMVFAIVLSATCRPELAAVLLPILVALAVAAGGAKALWALLRRVWPYALGCAALAAPIVAFGSLQTRAEIEQGNLPRLFDDFLARIPERLLGDNVVVQLESFPVAVWLPILLGLASREGRRTYWLVAAGVLAIIPTFVDHNETSNLRLQILTAELVVIAAALCAGHLYARMRAGGARVAVFGVVLAGALGSAVPSLEPLFRTRNPDQEESLIREARAVIASRTGRSTLLVRMGHGDSGERDLHLHFPDYLFNPLGTPTRTINSVLKVPHELAAFDDAYFLRSFRCYLWPSWKKEASGEQPACKRVCDVLRCEPVFEHDVANHGDWPTFDGYDKSPTLRVGLYRLQARSAPGQRM